MSQHHRNGGSNGHNGKPFTNQNSLQHELRDTEAAIELFSVMPELIARAWSVAQKLPASQRDACVVLIDDIMSKLPKPAVNRFAVDVIPQEKNYGGVWPKCFIAQARLKTFKAIINATLLGGQVDYYGELFTRFFTEGECWEQMLELLFDEHQQELLGDVVGDMLGICASSRFLPVPGGAAYMGEPNKPKDEQLLVPVPCWLGTVEMSVVDWKVPGKLRRYARAFIDAFLQEMRPARGFERMIRNARSRHDQIRGEINTLWNDFRRVAAGEKVDGFSSWILGNGLTHLWADLQDEGYTHTIGPIILIPEGQFPGMRVDIPWDICKATGIRVSEQNQLDRETGLIFDGSECESPSDEVIVRLLVSRALVGALHRHAFSPTYPRDEAEEKRERQKASGRVGRAVAPRFYHLPKGQTASDAAKKWGQKIMNGQLPPDNHSFRTSPRLAIREKQEEEGVEIPLELLPIELHSSVHTASS